MPGLAQTVLFAIFLNGLTPNLRAQEAAATAPAARIHSVTDIAHEFTFYFDGRFAQNYIGESGADARNWATLHKADLSNANLLILQSGAPPCPYRRPTCCSRRCGVRPCPAQNSNTPRPARSG